MLWAISINKIQNIHIWAGIDTLKFQDMYLWNKTYIWLVGDVFSSRVAKQSSVLGNSVVLFGVFFKNHDRPLEIRMTPCWSVLEFCKIRLEKSSSKNWIFSLQKSILKLIFKILLEIDLKSSLSNLISPNWFLRYQVEINRGIDLLILGTFT